MSNRRTKITDHFVTECDVGGCNHREEWSLETETEYYDPADADEWRCPVDWVYVEFVERDGRVRMLTLCPKHAARLHVAMGQLIEQPEVTQ